ncbi:hypothetical protein Poli38472_013182 [Pythium oligandrum]|uniref:Uncharacterized protein n=1 Tax=Pythium oligandrum TaxID=41045 RepID=A0A8K1FAP9_PYTOL|nr:hypothetical protein Poli38472_013182 [Pythium oligandrum]|eukprot:TMW55291.1 hypothetical protein Poli38472_013182 [Pythium oligandrum]
MGRVSSKRKIKQCDPFFKGSRDNGKKGKEYDLPPTESKSSKKRKRKYMSDEAIEQYVIRSSEVNNGTVALDKQAKKKKKLDGVGTIRENETMKDFNKRINTEVKRVIYEESKKTRRKSEKRKDFLQKKKEKEKQKKMTDQERYEQEYQVSGSTKRDTFAGVEKVRFGERVDAPPIMPKLKGIFKKRADAAAAAAQKKAKKGGPPAKKAKH